MTNHYQTLGIPNFSSSTAIQKAFRRLALQYHPDKHGGNKFYEDKFKEINAAYQVLSNPTTKERYDNILQYSYTTQPYKTTNQTENKRTQPTPEPKRKKEPRRRRKEKIITFSPFQETFIKVSIGLVGLSVLLIIVSNSFLKEPKGKHALITEYENLCQRIDQSIKNKQYTLAIQQIDSSAYFDSQNHDKPRKIFEILNILTEQANLAYGINNNLSLSKLKHASEIYSKYGYTESTDSKILTIDLLLKQNHYKEANIIRDELNARRISDLNTVFKLNTIYLKNGELKEAQLMIDKTTQLILSQLQSKYGATYKSVLETIELNPIVLASLIQSVSLNRVYGTTYRTINEDLISKLLQDEKEKEFYRLFKRTGFNIDKTKKQKLDTKFKDVINTYNLSRLFI